MSGVIARRIALLGGAGASIWDYIGATDAVWRIHPSRLFQDSAGTTPVTASGQPVGLILNDNLVYPAADWVQPDNAKRPTYLEGGGRSWIYGNGTQYMVSRSNGALASASAASFLAIRPDSGIPDYASIIGHPHAATHTDPFYRWGISHRTGGPTFGVIYDTGVNRYDISVPAIAAGVDALVAVGFTGMWDASTSSIRRALARVNRTKVQDVGAGTHTLTYPNSNTSMLFSNAAGAEIWKGRLYGGAHLSSNPATQLQVDIFENHFGALPETPL